MSPSLHANRSAALERLRPLLDEPPVAALTALPERFEAHLVGGALRDRLLGTEPRDLDAVVARDGEDAAKRLADTLGIGWFRLGGDRFAAYRMQCEGYRLDVWDRQEMDVAADLRRRDFTVNSIALRLSDLELIDPSGGLGDLDRRRLRATSESSFADDPLRVLRLARFATRLSGFVPAEGTVELARRAAPALSTVARERIREELRTLFGGGPAEPALELLARIGIYPGLWTGRSAEDPGVQPPLDRLRRLARRAADLAALPAMVDSFVASQAVLFATLPAGAERLEALRAEGVVANRDARDIRRLLDWEDLPSTGAERRWMLHRAGELWPTLAAFLGSATREEEAWRETAAALGELVGTEAEAIFAPAPLLDGHQIATLLGLEPGPRLGEAVAALRRAQIEGRVGSPEAAAGFLRERAD